MKGRGLAAAWGLLALVVGATIAWLALSDGREAVPAAPPAVTVALPPFPQPPADLPEPSAEPAPESDAASPPAEELGPARTEVPSSLDSLAADETPPSLPTATIESPEQTQQLEAEVVTAPAPVPPEPAATEQSATEQVPTEPVRTEPLAVAPPSPEPPADTAREVAGTLPPEAPAPPDVTALPEAPSPPTAARSQPAVRPPLAAPQQPLPPPSPSVAALPSEPARAAAEESTNAENQGHADAEQQPATVQVGALRPLPGPLPARLTPPAEPERDPALTEDGPFGPLPAVAPDGRRVLAAYSRPFSAEPAVSRIAIVIGNLGLASSVTEAAITDLPPEITLSFAPYANDVARWVAKARAAGHEVLLDLPMEPVDYPTHDPGPKALFTHLNPEENRERLYWVLSRADGYVGVTNFMGSRFTTSPDSLRPVLEDLRNRGLMFLDSRAAARSLATTMASDVGLPRAVNDRFIDAQASRAAIGRRLQELESIATREGAAVGIGYPYPVTIRLVAEWAEKIADRQDLVLAPVSAIVDRQADR